MAQRQPVARRPCVDGRLLDALDEPVPAPEEQDRPRRERLLAGVVADVLSTSAVLCDDVVREGQA